MGGVAEQREPFASLPAVPDRKRVERPCRDRRVVRAGDELQQPRCPPLEEVKDVRLRRLCHAEPALVDPGCGVDAKLSACVPLRDEPAAVAEREDLSMAHERGDPGLPLVDVVYRELPERDPRVDRLRRRDERAHARPRAVRADDEIEAPRRAIREDDVPRVALRIHRLDPMAPVNRRVRHLVEEQIAKLPAIDLRTVAALGAINRAEQRPLLVEEAHPLVLVACDGLERLEETGQLDRAHPGSRVHVQRAALRAVGGEAITLEEGRRDPMRVEDARERQPAPPPMMPTRGKCASFIERRPSPGYGAPALSAGRRARALVAAFARWSPRSRWSRSRARSRNKTRKGDAPEKGGPPQRVRSGSVRED